MSADWDGYIGYTSYGAGYGVSNSYMDKQWVPAAMLIYGGNTFKCFGMGGSSYASQFTNTHTNGNDCNINSVSSAGAEVNSDFTYSENIVYPSGSATCVPLEGIGENHIGHDNTFTFQAGQTYVIKVGGTNNDRGIGSCYTN